MFLSTKCFYNWALKFGQETSHWGLSLSLNLIRASLLLQKGILCTKALIHTSCRSESSYLLGQFDNLLRNKHPT